MWARVRGAVWVLFLAVPAGAEPHYQLQDGPELFRASSLPVEFTNLEGVELVRGAFFEPR